MARMKANLTVLEYLLDLPEDTHIRDVYILDRDHGIIEFRVDTPNFEDDDELEAVYSENEDGVSFIGFNKIGEQSASIST